MLIGNKSTKIINQFLSSDICEQKSPEDRGFLKLVSLLNYL